MKKILIVNDLVIGGGVENVLSVLAFYLNERGYSVTVFSNCREKNFYKFYPKAVKHKYYYRFPFKKSNYIIIRIIKKLLRAIKFGALCCGYDTVVAIKEGQSMQLVNNIKNTKRKIGWIHTDYFSFHWTKRVFKDEIEEIECMKKFDSIICVSQAVKESVIKTVGNPGNLIVKYNPIDVENILVLSQRPCKLLRNPEKMLFVCVGRLVKQKGYVDLLKIFSQLNSKHDYEIWIIGDSTDEKYKKELNETILVNNLTENVKLLGEQKNPYNYVKQADWFISSSETESFGIAIQEALILGVPVITTNCPGACELLEEKYSIVVENMEEMKKNIENILSDQSITTGFSENVRKYYNVVKKGERLKEIEKVLISEG